MTTALKVVLNVPPLHPRIKRVVPQSALLIWRTWNYKPDDLTGSMRRLDESESFQIHQTVTDTMTKTMKLERFFDVAITDCNLCMQVARRRRKGHYCGTQMNLRKKDVWGSASDCRVARSLGNFPMVVQAEVYAITICALDNLKKGARIYVMSDRQVALRALSGFSFESKLVLGCINALTSLASRNRVTLMCVLGRVGIEGNEMTALP